MPQDFYRTRFNGRYFERTQTHDPWQHLEIADQPKAGGGSNKPPVVCKNTAAGEQSPRNAPPSHPLFYINPLLIGAAIVIGVLASVGLAFAGL